MNTAPGGMAASARAIIEALKAHDAKSATDIILIDRSEEMAETFSDALEKYDEENE